jgi:hypothetical protein
MHSGVAVRLPFSCSDLFARLTKAMAVLFAGDLHQYSPDK